MLPKVFSKLLSNIRPENTKLALVVRSDIKMSKGKTAAQCAHAAVLCYQQSQINITKKKLLDSWCRMGQPKIVLRVDTYDDIVKLQEKVKDVKIVNAIVRDAGKTQLEAGTATVLGIGPDKVENIDHLIAHLKLL